VEEMVYWLKKFQAKVDELTESKFLQFTIDIWDPNSPDDEITSSTNVKIKGLTIVGFESAFFC